MTIADYEAMFEAHKGQCAICYQSHVRLTIDHDHVTGAVRGLLCYRCNTMLRPIEDHAFTQAAFAYLDHHGSTMHKFFITKSADKTRKRQKREQKEARRA
jgi:hypothetical protein